ncbi:hypothetical protein ACN47E_002734 [Coniothyrium glycines]
MSNQELLKKRAYFEEQALLDVSDDEQDVAGEASKAMEAALVDSEAMLPPKLVRNTSSFLGATPKEIQAEFEAHTSKKRVTVRSDSHILLRSSTAPDLEVTRSFPVTKLRGKLAAEVEGSRKTKLRRVTSLPDVAAQTAFYRQVGEIPRELKGGKNVKPADNIKVEPEERQLFREKIIYFYPNDDVSMVRRTRIHKLIQLGAAWVTRWRDDITHVMLDDASFTYSQLLRHFNRAGFPRQVVLVTFDPYVPQCIQFGTVLDPSAQRFLVKGAPPKAMPDHVANISQSPDQSQTSLHIKPSRRQLAVQVSQMTDSNRTEEDVTVDVRKDEITAAVTAIAENLPSRSFEEIVEDSFITSTSDQNEPTETRHVGHFDDALTRAIREAKALAHLPLDDDDDATSVTASAFGDGDGQDMAEETSDSDSKQTKTFTFVSKASALRNKKALNLNTFQCMDPGVNHYTASNPNARTIQILEDMCKHYDQMQDHWRTLAYRKGITTLKKQSVKITTAKQAAALPFIGSRLAEKIEEIVLTDRLRKLNNTRTDPLDGVLRLFLGIYGVGLVQANKWIQAGYRTLKDLEVKAKLTASHKVGIEHYEDFNSRIPRAEVEAHGAVVKNALSRIDRRLKAIIGGSYRRGANDSGDIDLIISCAEVTPTMMRTMVFDELIPQLYEAGFLKASLTTPRQHDSRGTKWHGASCLAESKIWRRMDLLLVPEAEMGAALIYFTGNDIFNRSIRLLSRKKGMRLNQRGLYRDVKRGRYGEKLNEGVLVEGRSEKKIFEILGVPWREPHERIC